MSYIPLWSIPTCISRRILFGTRSPSQSTHTNCSFSVNDGHPSRSVARLATPIAAIIDAMDDRLFATDVIGVSQAVLNSRWPKGERRPVGRVIYNGLALDELEFADVPRSKPFIVQVGRIDQLKNQVKTVEVFAELHKRMPAIRLVLVGRAVEPYATDLEARVAQLGLSELVDFTGVRDDVLTRLLPQACLFLHPTKVEGLPGGIIESAAVGTPVVASDIKANREVAGLLEKITLLPLDYSAERWADAIERVLGEPVSLASRRSAFERFEQSPFNMTCHVDLMLTLWGVE